MRLAALLLALPLGCADAPPPDTEPPAGAAVNAPAPASPSVSPADAAAVSSPSAALADVTTPSPPSASTDEAPAEAQPTAPPAGDPGAAPTQARTVEASGGERGQAATLVERYDLTRRTARFELPGRLDEISGLAFSPDGRLFGHDDERARVHEIDPVTGEVGKAWDLGQPMVRADFEGIAIVGERFFLVTSRGLLYEFREGDDDAKVAYRVTDTGVGGRCEVEGLEYDPVDDALLLACKVATPDRGAIVVHRLPIDPTRPRLEPLRIPKAQLTALGLGRDFDPSGLAIDPVGSLVLVSARHERIIEVDRSGRVLSGYALSEGRHPQAEGIAFGPDGTLLIADERNGGDPRLTAYAPVDPGAGRPR